MRETLEATVVRSQDERITMSLVNLPGTALSNPFPAWAVELLHCIQGKPSYWDLNSRLFLWLPSEESLSPLLEEHRGNSRFIDRLANLGRTIDDVYRAREIGDEIPQAFKKLETHLDFHGKYREYKKAIEIACDAYTAFYPGEELYMRRSTLRYRREPHDYSLRTLLDHVQRPVMLKRFIDKAVDWIEQDNPLAIGASVLHNDQAGLLALYWEIGQRFPHILRVVGGNVFSRWMEAIATDHELTRQFYAPELGVPGGIAHVGVMGEGEQFVKKLTGGLLRLARQDAFSTPTLVRHLVSDLAGAVYQDPETGVIFNRMAEPFKGEDSWVHQNITPFLEREKEHNIYPTGYESVSMVIHRGCIYRNRTGEGCGDCAIPEGSQEGRIRYALNHQITQTSPPAGWQPIKFITSKEMAEGSDNFNFNKVEQRSKSIVLVAQQIKYFYDAGFTRFSFGDEMVTFVDIIRLQEELQKLGLNLNGQRDIGIDTLVRLGASEMSVDFSFELDSHTYTIKRRRVKKSGGNTALELWSGSHNLTEGTIKATQQKIINTLHLTFETFINSSFIRQGHADEFTTKGPTDRKRILADILGLDHYDKLEEKAKEKAKEAQTKLTLLEYQVLEIETELGFKEEREKTYTKLQEDIKGAENSLKEAEKICKSFEDQKQTIQIVVSSKLEEKDRYETLTKEVLDLESQKELKQKAIKEYQIILEKKELIEKSYQKLQDLKKEKENLEEKRSQLIKLKDQLAEIQKTIIELEERRNSKCNLLGLEIKKLETQNEQLQEEISHLKSNKTVCPTCGQAINQQKSQDLILENNKKIAENNLQLNQLNINLKKCQDFELKEFKESKDLEEKIKDLEEKTKEYSVLSSQISELDRFEQGFIKLQQAEVAVKTHQEALADILKILLSKQKELEKSKNFEEELKKYSQQLAEIEQNLKAQLTIKEERSSLLLDLTGKAGQQKQLLDRTTQMENLFKEKQAEQKKLTSEKEVYEELALAFGKRGIQAMIIEAAIPEIEDEANKLLTQLTEGRMRITLETQKETKTKVQTSEGKVHATVETLDIIISDEMGERAYELYSGGETFRVNFALRLAISKLLAHRAGAKLQFLVIDEGFGTQDAPGRARLVEVLDAIKDDFEKILIITHIEELKEEFPVRIEVSKNAGGSTFEIIGV